MIDVLLHMHIVATTAPTSTPCPTVTGGGLSQICSGNLPQPKADQGSITKVLETVLNIVGGLALLMIVVSGLRYVLSAGDPQKAGKAKDGIIYSLVGLVIAITAQAIVLFVANRLIQP
jgi:hypothetical protein